MSDISLVYTEITDSMNANIAASDVLVDASSSPVPNLSVTVPIDDSIKSAAFVRFQAEEEAKRLVTLASLKKEQEKAAEISSYVQEEQLKARVLEEQIRRMAEQAVIEAEARAVAIAKEKAIEAEMERLRKRTKTEVLEDTVSELSSELASLKAKQNDRYRC